MRRRVLLTGAAGFVGANLARRLAADGHELHLVLRPGSDAWRLAGVDAQRHDADLADTPALEQAFAAARPQWVFHLAAHGAYSWQTDWRRMVDANVTGTATLLDCAVAAGVESFVHAGSSSEYGLKDHPPAESEPLEPGSPYAVTKAAATHLCRHTARTRGLRAPTLRLYSVYGPLEEPGRLMPTLAAAALDGRLPPFASPDIARDFVHVDDVVEAFLVAAELPGAGPDAVYNVGSGVQTTLGELAELARQSFGIAAPAEFGAYAARSWDTTCWVADPRRIGEALGWRPRRTLEQGLRGLAAWLAEEPERLARYRGPAVG